MHAFVVDTHPDTTCEIRMLVRVGGFGLTSFRHFGNPSLVTCSDFVSVSLPFSGVSTVV